MNVNVCLVGHPNVERDENECVVHTFCEHVRVFVFHSDPDCVRKCPLPPLGISTEVSASNFVHPFSLTVRRLLMSSTRIKPPF